MNRHVLILTSVAYALVSLQGRPAPAQSLDEANREFMEHRIDKAFGLFEAVA